MTFHSAPAMTDSPEPLAAITADDWQVFACPHCGHHLKAKHNQAGGECECPSCAQTLIIPGFADQPAAPTPALISEANPTLPSMGSTAGLPEAGNLAVDRLGAIQFRSVNDPSVAIPEEGIRVRKRKRRSKHDAGQDTPHWESAAAPSQEGGHHGPQGEWEDVTTATVRQSIAPDGSVIETRKRIQKKRLAPLIEKIWRLLARLGRWSLMALGIIILVGAAVAGWYLARSQAPVIAQAEKVEQFPERFYPTMDEGAQAAKVVQDFLATDSIEKKLPLVRFPEKVLPLMDLWYKGRPDRPVVATRDELSESLTKILYIDGVKLIVITMLVQPEEEYRLYAVEATANEGFKVDWETAVGWQAMTVEEFIKGKPTTPQPFRVQAAPGDYYNGEYSDESFWFAVNLTYPGNADFHLYGYVERASLAGQQLMRLLGYAETKDKDGNTSWELVQAQSAPVILALAYLREGSTDPKQVTIHEVLHEQWFLRDGPAAGSARKKGSSQ